MAGSAGASKPRPSVPPSPEPTVHRITSARKGIAEDVRGRQRRYLVSMGVRTTCFLLAVIFAGWPRWFFIAGAVLLPYVAVVLANAGREPSPGPPGTLMETIPAQLGSRPETVDSDETGDADQAGKAG